MTDGVSGRFITLEGGEGVGKSTQAKRLAEALRQQGHDVIETREPGGSPGAEAIRKLLLEGEGDRWTAPSEALLFAAARADHVARTIRPAIEAGQWVVCDRFLDSSLAYQGGASGISADDLVELHRIGCDGFLPCRTLLLRLPPAEAAARAHERDQGRGDRFEARGAEFHARVEAAFDALALRYSDRIRTIDAQGAPQDVTARLIAAIEDL